MAKLDDLECRRLVAARNYDALIRLVTPHVTRFLRRTIAFRLHPEESELAAQIGVWRAALYFDPDGAASFLRFALWRTKSVIVERRLSHPSMVVSPRRNFPAYTMRRAQAGEPAPKGVPPVAWEAASAGVPQIGVLDDNAHLADAETQPDWRLRVGVMRERIESAVRRRHPTRAGQWAAIIEWLLGGDSPSALAPILGCTPQNAGIIARAAREAVRGEFAEYAIAEGAPSRQYVRRVGSR